MKEEKSALQTKNKNANTVRNTLLKYTDKEMKEKEKFFPKKARMPSIEDFRIEFKEFYTSFSRENQNHGRLVRKGAETASTKDSDVSGSRLRTGLFKSISVKDQEIGSSIYLLSLVSSIKKKRQNKMRVGTFHSCSREQMKELFLEMRKNYKRKQTVY